MANFDSTQYTQGVAPAAICPPNVPQRAYAKITVSANPTDGDIYRMLRLPAGATVVGGYVYADDLDTNATETLDIDIGWAGNGTESADPDGFGNLGVWTGDAVTGIKPEVGNFFLLGGVLFTTGPQTFTNETVIQLEANATAATFAAGDVWIVVDYVL